MAGNCLSNSSSNIFDVCRNIIVWWYSRDYKDDHFPILKILTSMVFNNNLDFEFLQIIPSTKETL